MLFAAGERPIFGTASTSGVIAVELGGGAAAEAEEENEALRQAALLHAVDVQLCDLGGLAKMYGGPAMAHKITSKGLRSFGQMSVSDLDRDLVARCPRRALDECLRPYWGPYLGTILMNFDRKME